MSAHEIITSRIYFTCEVFVKEGITYDLNTDVRSAYAARLEAAKVRLVGRLRPRGLAATEHLL